MSALDMMLSNMLGMKPQELADIATKMQTAITTIGANLQALKEGQEKILAQLERIENGNKNGSDGNGSANSDT